MHGCGCADGVPPAIAITVRPAGANLSLDFIAVPPGLLPTSTHLLMRNPSGAVVLTEVAFSSLTTAHWGTYRVLYRHANSDAVEIASGDSLLVNREAYPAGSTFVIEDGARVLTSGSLP